MKPLFPSLPILLVDDEPSLLRGLALMLRRLGGIDNLIKCDDSRLVLDLLDKDAYSLIILDLTMPYLTGLELLPRIVQNHPDVPVIILSGLNQAETAVQCIREGAFDYFVKTVEQERLLAGVRRALAHQELRREFSDLKSRFFAPGLTSPEAFSAFITQCPAMHAVFRYLEAVAPSSEPILITGESGVGKELVAQALHRLGRPEAPWVPVNAAGLDDNVFADTLFGHLRGAFTGAERPRAGMIEQAGSGTLFLDEIGDLNISSQVKLLRLLQEGDYYPLGSDTPKRSNARLIFATNVDLAEKMQAGSFRKDLFYRLQTHHIHIPPLRQRRGDLPLLLQHFLDQASRDQGRKTPRFPPELVQMLETYHFPGNIRELRAMVYDALSQHQNGQLSMASFKRAMGQTSGRWQPEAPTPVEGAPAAAPISFPDPLPTLTQIQDQLVGEALQRSQGNQTLAAQLLGISRQALNKRVKKSF